MCKVWEMNGKQMLEVAGLEGQYRTLVSLTRQWGAIAGCVCLSMPVRKINSEGRVEDG